LKSELPKSAEPSVVSNSPVAASVPSNTQPSSQKEKVSDKKTEAPTTIVKHTTTSATNNEKRYAEDSRHYEYANKKNLVPEPGHSKTKSMGPVEIASSAFKAVSGEKKASVGSVGDGGSPTVPGKHSVNIDGGEIKQDKKSNAPKKSYQFDFGVGTTYGSEETYGTISKLHERTANNGIGGGEVYKNGKLTNYFTYDNGKELHALNTGSNVVSGDEFNNLRTSLIDKTDASGNKIKEENSGDYAFRLLKMKHGVESQYKFNHETKESQNDFGYSNDLSTADVEVFDIQGVDYAKKLDRESKAFQHRKSHERATN
jgi:hypothetical protein